MTYSRPLVQHAVEEVSTNSKRKKLEKSLLERSVPLHADEVPPATSNLGDSQCSLERILPAQLCQKRHAQEAPPATSNLGGSQCSRAESTGLAHQAQQPVDPKVTRGSAQCAQRIHKSSKRGQSGSSHSYNFPYCVLRKCPSRRQSSTWRRLGTEAVVRPSFPCLCLL